LVHLLVARDQWDEDADHIGERTGSDRDQAMLVTILRDLFGFVGSGSFRFLRLHQFDGLHAAEAAHVTNDRPAALPLAGPTLETITEFVGTNQQIFFFKQIEHSQCGGAGERVAGKGAAEAAGSGRIHNFCASGDSSERQTAAQRFRGNKKIRLDAIALAREKCARTSEAGLNFVGNKQNSVLVAEIDQRFEVIRRRSNESTFSQDRFGDHGGNFFVGNDAFEGVFEMARAVKIAGRIFQIVRAAITVGERDAVHLAGERREASFIGMGLAGEGKSHHCAAMESVFEGDDGGALGVGTRDLDRVLYSFRATVDEQSFLGKLSRRYLVHALGKPDVAFVGRDLNAGVQEFVELAADGIDYSFLSMTSVGTANAAGKIDVAVAVDVFEPCIFGFGYIDGRTVRETAGYGLRAALGERSGFWTGNLRAYLNCGHRRFSVASDQ